jgi:hypothetical protein
MSLPKKFMITRGNTQTAEDINSYGDLTSHGIGKSDEFSVFSTTRTSVASGRLKTSL